MMMDFQSSLKPYLNNFYNYKKEQGYKFENGYLLLKKIDAFALKHKLTSNCTSATFIEDWCKKNPNESISTWQHRFGALKSFLEYSSTFGLKTTIPVTPVFGKFRYEPFIFTIEQVSNLFSEIDKLRLKRNETATTLFAMPAMIRFLYATGCRRGEAVNLKLNDINFSDKSIKIADIKSHRERLIPIDSKLSTVLETYHRFMIRYKKAEQDDYFFRKPDGSPIGSSVSHWYRRCLVKLSIYNQNGYPRIHDLRHTFAVHSLKNILQSTKHDFRSAIMVLSNYLGHSTIESTEYYLRLTKAKFPEIVQQVDDYLNTYHD